MNDFMMFLWQLLLLAVSCCFPGLSLLLTIAAVCVPTRGVIAVEPSGLENQVFGLRTDLYLV